MTQPRDDGAPGTRKLVLTGMIIAAALLIAGVVWSLLDNPLGVPRGGVDEATNRDLTELPGLPAQKSGESAVGKNDPGGQPGPAGARQRAIKSSARPLSLTDEQRAQVSAVVSEHPDLSRTDQSHFELMIGVLVPSQISLSDIPPRVTEIMNGYYGARCIVVGNVFIIVDLHTRRIVALVPLSS